MHRHIIMPVVYMSIKLAFNVYKFKVIFAGFEDEDSYSDPLGYDTVQSGIRPIGEKTETVCSSETLVLST
jgi:hypothetical protein